MNDAITLTSQDPILKTLGFKPYQDSEERRVSLFLPNPDEPQTMTITTPWGAQLTAKKGYLLVADADEPDELWPIDPEIFSKSYAMTRPGYCKKIVPTDLVPLTDLTEGRDDEFITIESLEGPETVRAGDFYLARGVDGEIWPIPKGKTWIQMGPVNAD